MLSGLYIISSAGIPLYFHSEMKSEGVDNDILFSGVITAIQKLLIELQVGEVTEFKTSNYNVVLYNENKFAYAFLISKQSKLDNTAINLLHIGLNEHVKPILKDYDELEELNTNVHGVLSLAVSNVLRKWELDQKESNASKKAKESLW